MEWQVSLSEGLLAGQRDPSGRTKREKRAQFHSKDPKPQLFMFTAGPCSHTCHRQELHRAKLIGTSRENKDDIGRYPQTPPKVTRPLHFPLLTSRPRNSGVWTRCLPTPTPRTALGPEGSYTSPTPLTSQMLNDSFGLEVRATAGPGQTPGIIVKDLLRAGSKVRPLPSRRIWPR